MPDDPSIHSDCGLPWSDHTGFQYLKCPPRVGDVVVLTSPKFFSDRYGQLGELVSIWRLTAPYPYRIKFDFEGGVPLPLKRDEFEIIGDVR